MGSHVFVDESKARGFTLVAVRVENRDVARLRKAMRELLMPGQERIHFNKERDSRRKQALSELARHRLHPIIIVSGLIDLGAARDDCLAALISLVGARPETAHVVVELDNSLAAQDARLLNQRIHELGLLDAVSFELLPPRQDPGLWIADAIAWADHRRGDWSRRIAMHPTERIHL